MQGDGSLGLPALRAMEGWCLRDGDALTGEFYTEFLEQQRRSPGEPRGTYPTTGGNPIGYQESRHLRSLVLSD